MTESEKRKQYLIAELRKLGRFPNAENWGLADLEWVHIQEKNRVARRHDNIVRDTGEA